MPAHPMPPAGLKLKKIAMVVAVALPAIAQAQQAEKVTLPEVVVNATEENAWGPVDGYMAKRSATATKTDTPLSETPQSVTVISADQVRDQGSTNLQEVLRYAAGVRNELYGIDNRGDWFSIRGSDQSTVFLDGMRLPLTGSWGVMRAEPYAFERIEILRGPSSIIAGAMDPGGIVNMVSKRPQSEAMREVGVTVGNYNHAQIQADLTGPANEDGSLLYRLVALGKDSGTQVQHADEERTLIAPSLTWKPNALDSVTVYAEYQRDNSQNTNAFFGLEGTLNPAPNGYIPSDTFIGEPAWDTYGGTRHRVGYAVDVGLNDTWRVRNNFRYDDTQGVMKSMYAAWWDGFRDQAGNPDPNGQYMNRAWYAVEDRSRIASGELLLQGDFNIGAVKHTVLAGVDGMYFNANSKETSGMATPLNVYNPVYGSFPEPTISGGVESYNKIYRTGFLLQDQMKIADRLNVRVGVRHDTIRNQTPNPGAEPGSATKKDSATSYNIGAIYEAWPGISPYASYSESFDPVAGGPDTGGPFSPKRGKQYEAGVKWAPKSMPLQASAAIYSITESSRLANHPTDPNLNVQTGEGKIKGLELEAVSQIGDWNVIGTYTHIKAEATASSWGGSLTPDEQIEGIPKDMATLWAVYDLGRHGLPGLKLGGGARYTGKIGDGTGNVFVPDVTLFDAMASYQSGPWNVALNINNVADKEYIATCLARGDCWFGQRRMALLTATYSW